MKVNRAHVASSKAHLAQTLITAPFSGKLGLRQVNVGDQVGPDTPIVNLQAIDPVYIDFTVPESEILKLAVGRQVSLDDDAYPNTKFIGTVKAIESVVNTNAQSITVRAEVPTAKHLVTRHLHASDLINRPATKSHQPSSNRRHACGRWKLCLPCRQQKSRQDKSRDRTTTREKYYYHQRLERG